MQINEIFVSIQGEGPAIGTPCIFIRFSNCNLSCPFCDTNFAKYTNMSLDDVMTKVQTLRAEVNPDISLCVITGGEPTVSAVALKELITTLHMYHFTVHIETNGVIDAECLELADEVICSPKEQGHYKVSKYATYLKYVVTKEFTGDEIPEVIREKYAGRIYLQPEGSEMAERWMDCMVLALNDPRLRVGVQLHKLIGIA